LLIDINPGENPFQTFAQDQGGFWLQGSASEWVPFLAEILGHAGGLGSGEAK